MDRQLKRNQPSVLDRPKIKGKRGEICQETGGEEYFRDKVRSTLYPAMKRPSKIKTE